MKRKAHPAWTVASALAPTLVAIGLAADADAQPAWKPTRTVEIVVVSGPGGGNDKIGRVMQHVWQESKSLENSVVVNKVGGGGAVAYAYTSQKAGDAHTIVVARTGLLSNHILGLSPVNYTDLTPLALIGDEVMSLSVRADSPIKSVKDLVERWRADPQSVSIALGSARGSTTQYLLALIAKPAGVDPRKLKTVTFAGASESFTNLLGGHIDMMSVALGNVIEQHKAGAVRVIGIGRVKRSPFLPDVPTMIEQGFDAVQGGWFGVMGPRGLTAAQVAYWESMLERVVNNPQFKQYLDSDGVDSMYVKSQEMRDYLKRDYEKAKGLLADLGMTK